MIDRTDLQLLLCEQIMEMDTGSLIEMAFKVAGHDLEMYQDDEQTIIGSVETLQLADPRGLKKWLGFMLYALGERVLQDQPEG